MLGINVYQKIIIHILTQEKDWNLPNLLILNANKNQEDEKIFLITILKRWRLIEKRKIMQKDMKQH